MARETAITVNVSKQVKALVEARADEDGRSVSNYILRLIKADLGWPKSEVIDDMQAEQTTPTPESLAALMAKTSANHPGKPKASPKSKR